MITEKRDNGCEQRGKRRSVTFSKINLKKGTLKMINPLLQPIAWRALSRRSLLATCFGAMCFATALATTPVLADDQSEIVLGALMPLSGSGGPFGQEMLASAKIALEEINAAGGPLGRKIKLIEENDETNPEAAVRAARKLVEVDKVKAIFGTWASSVTLAVAPIVQEKGIILMSNSGASRITEVQKKGNIYRLEPDDLLFGKAYAEYASQQGWKKAAVLGLNVPFTQTTVEAFKQRFSERGGKITSFVTYNEEQTTFITEVARALSDQPDFVHISGYEPDITAVLKAAYQSGASARFIVPGFAVSADLIKNAGPAADGLLLVEEGVSEDSPAYQRLAEHLGKDHYYSFGAQAYDELTLLALAIEAAKSTDGAALNKSIRDVSGPEGTKVTSFAEGIAALRKGERINYDGASGPLDFDQDGNIAQANFRVSQVKDGKTTPVGNISEVKF
ncbi:ABC transporter substrate-binding protein [Pararhizobium sp. YC-54]|uniref:ABC transporter substrate-binding protein n=1 Tax=Pararhizobium sp. YC-54 TaxID=2986920 RepID=UPI0021F6EDC0|nr:ABC transporter substrate-binding protein [Pararhizobium sp. YC-54]MCV9999323.1 ABC transporter substrate-binding protein [Pararhizobium sp. YC-54]